MSTSVPSDTRAKTARQLRKVRQRRLVLRLGLGVGLPTLLAMAYYGTYVTPQYQSVTTFTIESADGAAPTNALQMLVASVPGSSGRDVALVREYVSSRDMLNHLTEEHRWADHFGAADVDWVSRLSADAPFEERYAHFLDQVEVIHDSDTGVLHLHVKAFDAESSHRFGEAILAESERMVNELSDTSRNDRIELSRSELERAETRLAAARRALRELQAERGDLNPVASAEAILSIRSRLEGELAIARANLSTVVATMPRGAPEITAARRRISALERQITAQSDRLSGDGESGEGGINAELEEFEPIMVEKEFAQRAYSSALTSLELARVDASRQHRYLVRIAGPSQPDDPTHPRFWYSVLTVLAMAFSLMGIGTLLLASIREHANV
ncbi:MAG: hypothetical protein AB8I08_37250 [Sandaracinaceae bacterium]